MSQEYAGHDPSPEEVKRMEELLSGVMRNLHPAAADDRESETEPTRTPPAELPKAGDEANAFLKKVESDEQDDASDRFKNIEPGTLEEVFYRTLIEEVPDLGLSIEDDAEGVKREPLPEYRAVHTMPYKTDRAFLVELRRVPLVGYLVNPMADPKLGERLEAEGALPVGMARRILARELVTWLHNAHDGANRTYLARELAALGNPEPVTDAEVADLLRPVIQEAYRTKLGL